MLTLTTGAFLVGLGFLAWALGYASGHYEIAVLGALIIVGFGTVAMTDGLAHRTGQVETVNDTANTTTVEYEYEPVDTGNQFPFGFVATLLGAVGMLQAINQFNP